MKKIPSLFERDFNQPQAPVVDIYNPKCLWVIAGEGIATRKYDGTAILIRDGKTYIRYDAKHGKKPPEGWMPCEQTADSITGHWPGWLPFDGKDKRLLEALSYSPFPDGTYELCGPKVNGNPERVPVHTLIRHADAERYSYCPRTFDALREFLRDKDIEGIVWHHPDGRMAKIKKRDFGLPRRPV